MHTRTPAHTRLHTHACTQMPAHTHARLHTHACTHACLQTHRSEHTHITHVSYSLYGYDMLWCCEQAIAHSIQNRLHYLLAKSQG